MKQMIGLLLAFHLIASIFPVYTASLPAQSMQSTSSLPAAHTSDIPQVTADTADTIVNVSDYGAKGDSTTDDTEAIRAAVAVLSGISNPVLYFPSAAAYKITGTIAVPASANANIIMDSPIMCYGDIPALEIGNTGASISARQLELWVEHKSLSDWTNDSCIGIKITNADACRITIKNVRNFTIGAEFIGDAGGFCYNEVTLGTVENNAYGLRLTNVNHGWCNENNFYGGKFITNSDISTDLSLYGIHITSEDISYTTNNNNIFHKPSFELLTPAEPAEVVPIWIEYGFSNTFYDCRNETRSDYFVRVSNNSKQNIVETGYGECAADEMSSSSFNEFASQRSKILHSYDTLVFDSGPVYKTACAYGNEYGYVHVPRVFMSYGGPGVDDNAAEGSGIAIYPDYLEIPQGIGIFVKTASCKEFVIRRDCESGYGGRTVIRCYDAENNILTDKDAGQPYVEDDSGALIYSESFGGAYSTGADSSEDYYFKVGADVDHIALLLTGGTNPIRLRSFQLFSKESTASTWVCYEEIQPGANLGIDIPPFGTWEKGRTILNISPEAGQPRGWICTVSGTMGTLNGNKTAGAIESGSRVLTVNAATGLSVGQYITIAGVSGAKKITAISGTSVTIDSAADATVKNASVSFRNGAWVSLGNFSAVTMPESFLTQVSQAYLFLTSIMQNLVNLWTVLIHMLSYLFPLLFFDRFWLF